MWLAHYNQNHDPKSGRFAKNSSVESKPKSSYYVNAELPSGKTAMRVRIPAWAARAKMTESRILGLAYKGRYWAIQNNMYKKVGFKNGYPYTIQERRTPK